MSTQLVKKKPALSSMKTMAGHRGEPRLRDVLAQKCPEIAATSKTMEFAIMLFKRWSAGKKYLDIPTYTKNMLMFQLGSKMTVEHVL